MGIVVHIYYTGKDGSARKFAEEMISSGIVDAVRAKEGNLKYDYYFPIDDKETVLLIDKWTNQQALDMHHKSDLMPRIADLRTKYKLKMSVEKFEYV
ncbi:MAG: antibiotic biosynthesis monooxygenase [Clostridia bacterium]|nr:antibiotic biosynthesis monooxygenase [Clostridia bacterium]MDE6472092.1 antibiotic biosynthesis monooxygenase [Clostridia bacterium]